MVFSLENQNAARLRGHRRGHGEHRGDIYFWEWEGFKLGGGGKIRNYANEVAAIPSDSLWKASINQITLESDNSKYKVDRTEDYHFIILTSHTSQQVEFFHSSMFC